MLVNVSALTSPQSEELLHLIIENVREYAIFAQDAGGVIVSWNPGVESLLDYGEKEFVGKHVSVIFTAEDARNGEVEKQMGEAAVVGRAIDRKWHVRRDGSRVWTNGLLMPLNDGDGKLQGFARIIRDDTEQKRYEDEREEMLAREREACRRAESLRQEVERANRSRDDFLALLAHELRSPLNAILGWVRMLRTGITDKEQATKALEVIERNAESQNRLIEDIFDASRISSGKLHLNEQSVSLAETISSTVESIRPAANAKNISLEIALDAAESANVLGDPDRLRQIVANLLSNAVKFTHEGGRISVRLECSESTACFVVEDNGQGIGAELLPHVFDRYAQANKDSTRGKAGLGLGLPLVRKLVERHGGEITAESAGEGRGAAFTVKLPLIEND
jgi:PAS domain S-box-containing protein